MNDDWWLNQFLHFKKNWEVLKDCSELLEQRDNLFIDFIKTLCIRDDEIGKQARETLYKAQNLKIGGKK